MHILFITLILVLSFTSYGTRVEQFLGKNFKLLSRIILFLAFASIGFLFTPDMLKDTGERAMDILWFLLFLPILAKVLTLPIAKTIMRYRKEIGILMGMLAVVHSTLYLTDTYTTILPWDIQFWIDNGRISYLWVGMVATFFTFLLLITSNITSMKFLGRKWKMLHRTVYIVILLTVLHVILLKWIDIGNILLLIIYFTGKWLEWSGKTINILPKKTNITP